MKGKSVSRTPLTGFMKRSAVEQVRNRLAPVPCTISQFLLVS